ncbi:MAG: hypothetical protein WB019_20195, partial [Pseudolabrys sp.]
RECDSVLKHYGRTVGFGSVVLSHGDQSLPSYHNRDPSNRISGCRAASRQQDALIRAAIWVAKKSPAAPPKIRGLL